MRKNNPNCGRCNGNGLPVENCPNCFPYSQDPYLSQGKNFRVHHPVQPKTQVEKWREEFWNNENAIETCCRKPDENNYYDCSRNGTDNCNERAKKNKDILGYITDATQPIHPRHPTGTFADDEVEIEIKNKPLMQLFHLFTGHPKKDCVENGVCSVRCRCGTIITLADYY